MSSNDGWRGDLTDLQRRGVDAVADVFERFIRQVEGPDEQDPRPGSGPARPDGPAPDAGSARPLLARAAVARAIDLYAELFQRTFDLYADLVENGSRTPGLLVSASEGSGSPVTLAGSPGEQAEASVWVHNGTEVPVVGVTLRMTDLTAHDGAGITASRGSFSPVRLDVSAAASASSRLSVAIPAAATARVYHGLVLATGLPWASLPVHLVVQP